MSDAQVRRRRDSGTWEVRWRDGGRRHGRTFADRREAERFARHVRRAIELAGVVELSADDLVVLAGTRWAPARHDDA